MIGYAGVDNHGLGGLELQYDRKLSGHPGKQTIVRDATGRAIDVISSSPVREGADVFTTIDHTIQANAEQVLRETVSKWGAKAATAIVLDPHDGRGARDGAGARLQREQRAAPARRPDAQPRRHRHVRAGLDLQARHRHRRPLGGARHADDEVHAAVLASRSPNCCIHDAENRGDVDYSVAQILKYSSNVGAITLAEKLGAPSLADWIDRFGFGQQTGIDFPGESAGLVLPLDAVVGLDDRQRADRPGDRRHADPDGVGLRGGRERRRLDAAAPRRPRRRPARRSRRTHRRIMSRGRRQAGQGDAHRRRRVGGTGTAAAIPGYTVAGKTGTAQKPTAAAATRPTEYIASFVGMVPASKPRLVVLVVVDEPQRRDLRRRRRRAGVPAIAKFDLQYLEVPPDAPATDRGSRRTDLKRALSLRATGSGALHRGGRPGRSRERGARGDRRPRLRHARCHAGSLFFCVRGTHADGHAFAPTAAAAGASALVVERPLDVALPQLVVADVARGDGVAAATLFFGEPTRELDVAGGHRHERQDDDRLPAARDPRGGGPTGRPAHEYRARVAGEARPTGLNTPEAIDLQRLFREMLDARRPTRA